MSCEHEWIESIRCAKCGQAIESRIAVGRELDEALDLLYRWQREYADSGIASRETLALLIKHGRAP